MTKTLEGGIKIHIDVIGSSEDKEYAVKTFDPIGNLLEKATFEFNALGSTVLDAQIKEMVGRAREVWRKRQINHDQIVTDILRGLE